MKTSEIKKNKGTCWLYTKHKRRSKHAAIAAHKAKAQSKVITKIPYIEKSSLVVKLNFMSRSAP